ncbi:MAG: hypothetical protein ACFFD4_23220 [Candidatus Odinarchaeota archaeon]
MRAFQLLILVICPICKKIVDKLPPRMITKEEAFKGLVVYEGLRTILFASYRSWNYEV